MMEVYAPADVVTAVIGFLKSKGVNARDVVPRERPPGMVRVTRSGGQPISYTQDQAMILIEVWDKTTLKSWNTAIRLWALFAAIEEQDTIPGLLTYKVIPTIPIQMPDEYAPELDRQQFTVEIINKMIPYEI